MGKNKPAKITINLGPEIIEKISELREQTKPMIDGLMFELMEKYKTKNLNRFLTRSWLMMQVTYLYGPIGRQYLAKAARCQGMINQITRLSGLDPDQVKIIWIEEIVKNPWLRREGILAHLVTLAYKNKLPQPGQAPEKYRPIYWFEVADRERLAPGDHVEFNEDGLMIKYQERAAAPFGEVLQVDRPAQRVLVRMFDYNQLVMIQEEQITVWEASRDPTDGP